MNETVVAPPGWLPLPGSDALQERALGPLFLQEGQDPPRYGFRVAPGHLNDAGVMHGGAITALFDAAFYGLARHVAGDAAMVTLDLGCRFLNPARVGDWLVADLAVVKRGRSLLFMEGWIATKDAVVASANALYRA